MGNWKNPSDCKYTRSDEWVRVSGDEAQVGITDYAQDQLSDLVFVEFPSVGESFEKGQTFGVVESVKAAADVQLPIGGEILEVNTMLEDSPEIINEDPFDKGWLVRIKVGDTTDLDDLMDATAYAAYCDERAG